MVRSTTQTPGLDDEALHPIGSLDDLGLEIGQDAGQGAVKDRPLIGAVGEHVLPRKGNRPNKVARQRETAVAILNVGGGDDADAAASLAIDQNACRFLPLISLPASKPWLSNASPPFSALRGHSDCR